MGAEAERGTACILPAASYDAQASTEWCVHTLSPPLECVLTRSQLVRAAVSCSRPLVRRSPPRLIPAGSSFRRSSHFLQTMATPATALKPAQAFVEFVNASPTPFHAVHESVVRLERAGFTRSVLSAGFPFRSACSHSPLEQLERARLVGIGKDRPRRPLLCDPEPGSYRCVLTGNGDLTDAA